MSKTTKSKRPSNLTRSQVSEIKSTKKSVSAGRKTERLTPVKRALLAGVTSTIEPIKFGKVGENSLIYLKEGVENLVSELQTSIAEKEAAKKDALEALKDFENLPATCTMYDIRTRLNATVNALIEVFNAM